MGNTQFYSADDCIKKIIEKIAANEHKDAYLVYVYNTIEICYNLCENGEEISVLNEIRFMLVILIEQLGL